MAKRLLLLILLLALALRLLFAFSQDSLAPYADRSGDSGWYLLNAYALVTGHRPGDVVSDEIRFERVNYLVPYTLITSRELGPMTVVSTLSSPPVYFLVTGVPQALLASPADAIIAVRVFQALLSTATCFFAYRLALRLSRSERAGLLAAFALAISPAFIVESAQILTETVFIFLLAGGIWLYVESIVGSRRKLALLLLAAIFLGAATLTRAILLAFPFGLAVHLLLVYGWSGLRLGIQRAALFLLVYALVVSTWTVYTVTQWNRFVIAGEGLPSFLYLGTTGWDSAQQVDQRLAEQSNTGDPIEAAGSVIARDPLGWVTRRVSELAGAYLQPHGTTFFPGESLRELAAKWLRDDRSLPGLMMITQGESFWQKLALYAFHYTALVAGLVGIWRHRRNWKAALPMLGLIAYITLAHLALLALPRYLFPLEVFWWVFAAAAFVKPAKVEGAYGR